MKSVSLGILMLLTIGLKAQESYFQQEVNYIINVKLDDRNHFLHGDESFEYINNSNQTLSYLYIHLWPNAYKNQKTAMAKQLFRDRNYVFFNALRNEKGFIDSLDFKVNGEKIQWSLDSMIQITLINK